jgi:hypothetical protein
MILESSMSYLSVRKEAEQRYRALNAASANIFPKSLSIEYDSGSGDGDVVEQGEVIGGHVDLF